MRYRLRERAMLIVAAPLLFISPIVEVFGTLSIPLFSEGGLLFLAHVAAGGLALGLLTALAFPPEGGRLRSGCVVGLTTATILMTVDLSAGGHAVLSSVAAERTMRLVVLLVVTAGLGSIVWVARRHVPALMFIAATAFFVSTASKNVPALTSRPAEDVVPAGSDSEAATDQAPVVYMLLDEAMGIEGLRSAPGGELLAGEIRDLLVRYGFRVHGGAFSRHYVSARSIPNALNFDFRDDSWGPVLRHQDKLKVRSRLFEDLAEQGYDVISYGTEHIDFCFEVASRCAVLPSFNPFSAYMPDDGRRTPWVYQVVGHSKRRSYVLYRYVQAMRSRWDGGRTSPLTALDIYAFGRWFARFEQDVMTAPRGKAYFAHFLMPHAPYIYDETCGETGAVVVGYFLSEERQLTGERLDTARAGAYDAYVRQYRCLLGLLDGFLARLEASPAFADATIVIHGDHGARISAGRFFEGLQERDIIDNHSALYAIRAPGVSAGYDRRKSSVQRLSAEYLSGEEPDALGPDEPTVVIDLPERGHVTVVPMPDIDPARESHDQR